LVVSVHGSESKVEFSEFSLLGGFLLGGPSLLLGICDPLTGFRAQGALSSGRRRVCRLAATSSHFATGQEGTGLLQASDFSVNGGEEVACVHA
jgi:hypothetical protein